MWYVGSQIVNARAPTESARSAFPSPVSVLSLISFRERRNWGDLDSFCVQTLWSHRYSESLRFLLDCSLPKCGFQRPILQLQDNVAFLLIMEKCGILSQWNRDCLLYQQHIVSEGWDRKPIKLKKKTHQISKHPVSGTGCFQVWSVMLEQNKF